MKLHLIAMDRRIYLTILTVIILFVAWHVIDILLIAFAGVLLAIFLRVMNRQVKKIIPLPDAITMTITLLILASAFLLVLTYTAPLVSEQLRKLITEIPKAWSRLQEAFPSITDVKSLFDQIDQQWLPETRNIFIKAASLFSTTFGFIGSFGVFLFVGVFLAYDPDIYVTGFLYLIPLSHRPQAKLLLESITATLISWLSGMTLSMTFVGLSTSLGLWFLGVPMALTLGLIAALFTFIPNMGPILAAIPAVLIALIQGPFIALYTIALYIVVQLFESNLVTPLIQRKTISLPPVLILLFQLIMALLTGILGLALATPLLIVLTTFLQKTYIQKESA